MLSNEWLEAMGAEEEDGQSGWVDVGSEVERGLRECIVLDLEASRRAERRIIELFLRVIENEVDHFVLENLTK